MSKRQVNKGIKIIRESVIDEIVEKLVELKVDENIIKSIKDDKKPVSNRKKPNIPFAKQCSAMCKSGNKCTVAICDKTNKLCWAHMSKEQKELHRSKKN